MEKNNPDATLNRRPLRVREWSLVKRLSVSLAKRGVLPNQVSLFSMAGAAIAAAGIVAAGMTASFAIAVFLVIVALIGIFLRVMANLIDGMIAVEGGHRTPSGEIYNDVPDRVSDSIIFIAMGYAAAMCWAGWLAALLAMMTAYVRLLGGACGVRQSFMGPMAKPHRMAVMVAALLALVLEKHTGGTGGTSLACGLAVICIGSAWTVWRRLMHIVKALECPPG